MNKGIVYLEQKMRLNTCFEVLEQTFDNYKIKVVGKGVNFLINQKEIEIYLELLFEKNDEIIDKYCIMNINMYDKDGIMLLHESEEISRDYYEDLCVFTINFNDLSLLDVEKIMKIRIYLEKSVD